MRLFSHFVLLLVLLFSTFSYTSAGFFDSFINDGAPDIRYCDDSWECGLSEGIDIIKWWLEDIETERTLSEYVQDVVIYILTFVSIIAVIYIIYAGFMILIGNGDDEKVKKSKQTIIYVAVWMVLIWLAWPITALILDILGA